VWILIALFLMLSCVVLLLWVGCGVFAMDAIFMICEIFLYIDAFWHALIVADDSCVYGWHKIVLLTYCALWLVPGDFWCSLIIYG